MCTYFCDYTPTVHCWEWLNACILQFNSNQCIQQKNRTFIWRILPFRSISFFFFPHHLFRFSSFETPSFILILFLCCTARHSLAEFPDNFFSLSQYYLFVSNERVTGLVSWATVRRVHAMWGSASHLRCTITRRTFISYRLGTVVLFSFMLNNFFFHFILFYVFLFIFFFTFWFVL